MPTNSSTSSPNADKGFIATATTTTATPTITTPFYRQSYIYKSLPTRLNRNKTKIATNKISKTTDKVPSLHNLNWGSSSSNSNKPNTTTTLSRIDNKNENQQNSTINSQIHSIDDNVDDNDDDERASTPLGNDVLRLHLDDCLQELDDYLEQLDTSGSTTKRDNSFGESVLRADDNFNVEPYSLNSNETEAGLDSLNESSPPSQMQQQNVYNNVVDDVENLPRYSSADFESTNFNEPWPSKLEVKLKTPQTTNNEVNQSRSSTDTTSNQTLTTEQIFNNFLIECSQEPTAGPRQLGRRATGQPTVLSARSHTPVESSVARSYLNSRPYSAPAQNSRSSHNNRTEPHYHIATTNLVSETSSMRTSHNPSPISSVYTSTDSSSLSAATNPHIEASVTLNLTSAAVVGVSGAQNNEATQNTSSQQATMVTTSSTTAAPAVTTTKSHSQWPYVLSQSFALTTCTLGLFNICRFSTLVLNYGGNFVLQFLLLSFFFGIPLLWLQMCLGARIKNGPVTMWRISPICKGIGISLIIVQFVISIYSAVCLAWLLIYLRDSLPNSNQFVTNVYRSRVDESNSNVSQNASVDFTNDVGQYFSVHVLQRLVGDKLSFRISEKLAFYLAFLWTGVFLILCRGLRSFGNFVYLLSPVPLLMLAVIVAKLLFIVDCSRLRNVFSASYLEEFLISPHAWIAAAQETFITWGLLGPSVIAMTSRKHTSASKTSLRSNAIYVVFVTFFGLFLAAILGLCAMEVLERNSFLYIPGSYETPETSKSIFYKPRLEPDMISFPPQLVPHYSGFIGETYRRTLALAHQKSGYQSLRFISEIFPAFAVLSRNDFTWGWTFALLLTLLLFGLAQLCAMWKPISSALGNSTNAVLLSCVTGLLLSIPFTTEIGIHILHYVDIIFGASWIVPLLWMALIFGIFLVRGRPYNGDDLVNDLKMCNSISAFLALAWNVLLPIGLPTLAVISYKMSNSSQFFNWRSRVYFSFWERKIAGIIQVTLLLMVPVIAIIQIVRYLNRGPADILERIQLLYRPPEGNEARSRLQSPPGSALRPRSQLPLEEDSTLSMPPPKYTPPPSYTTATGARMAKMLRQSIRRSVRRIRAVASNSRPWSMETENELIVANSSNNQAFHDISNIENAEDSFTHERQQRNSNESPRIVPTAPRSLTSNSLRPRRPDRRSQSLPRSLQRSTISNFSSASTTTTTDCIDRLLQNSMNTTISRELTAEDFTASRSVDNLATNAEPLDQSQPPLHIIIRTKNKQF